MKVGYKQSCTMRESYLADIEITAYSMLYSYALRIVPSMLFRCSRGWMPRSRHLADLKQCIVSPLFLVLWTKCRVLSQGDHSERRVRPPTLQRQTSRKPAGFHEFRRLLYFKPRHILRDCHGPTMRTCWPGRSAA
jgi:hypothetical protein